MDFLMKYSTLMHKMSESKEYFAQMASYSLQMLTTLNITNYVMHLMPNRSLKIETESLIMLDIVHDIAVSAGTIFFILHN